MIEEDGSEVCLCRMQNGGHKTNVGVSKYTHCRYKCCWVKLLDIVFYSFSFRGVVC